MKPLNLFPQISGLENKFIEDSLNRILKYQYLESDYLPGNSFLEYIIKDSIEGSNSEMKSFNDQLKLKFKNNLEYPSENMDLEYCTNIEYYNDKFISIYFKINMGGNMAAHPNLVMS